MIIAQGNKFLLHRPVKTFDERFIFRRPRPRVSESDPHFFSRPFELPREFAAVIGDAGEVRIADEDCQPLQKIGGGPTAVTRIKSSESDPGKSVDRGQKVDFYRPPKKDDGVDFEQFERFFLRRIIRNAQPFLAPFSPSPPLLVRPRIVK